MELLRSNKPSGFSAGLIRTWGLIFLCAGAIGQGLIQTQMLGVGELTPQQLLDVMNNTENGMLLVSLALLMEVLNVCAVPLFALLTVEGFCHTSDFRQYLLRVLGLAVVCELPYNLVVRGKLFDLSSRNPVFGVALVLIALYFFNRYPGKKAKDWLIKLAILAAALIWGRMLNIQDGVCLMLIAGALWAFRNKPNLRHFAGAGAAGLCCAFSYYYILTPMVFLIISKYNGEKGAVSRKTAYLTYPVILVLTAAVGMILF